MKIPYRNKSPYGWWVACYLERFEFYDEDQKNPNRRCKAWENTIIINAKTREGAYKKAIKCGKLSHGQEFERNGRKGRSIFEGLTSLIPIYEELADGAEIIWEEHENRTVKSVRSLVKKKNELETFTDE